jgi:DNA (cytosine-5)-methyltransferase 1
MRSFYNDADAYCCSWLSNLMDAGLITPGIISDTPIERLDPTELSGFRRVHLFAGLGGWERACQFADWGDRPIWTGSAPCQPFSLAGARRGIADHRHLWPDFFRLIRALRPALVVGEQTSGRLGYSWFDGVATDLERENYACRAVDIPACAVDAPHRRNRLYWVALADTASARCNVPQNGRPNYSGTKESKAAHRRRSGLLQPERSRDGIALANTASGQLPQPLRRSETREGARSVSALSAVANADRERQPQRPERDGQADGPEQPPSHWNNALGSGSFWDNYSWTTGADGKARRVSGNSQSDVRGVAHGLPAGMDGVRASTIPLLTHGEAQRVAKLRALGNAIVPQLAAEVLRALKPQGDLRDWP